MNLAGKNVLVTGASSGIGLALTKQLQQRGNRVMAVARSIADVNLDGADVHKYACDVSVRQNVDRMFEEAIRELGGLDVLVCNAGFAYYGPIVGADWGAIERIYRLNVFSTIYSALKMKEFHAQRPYRVVLTASAQSFLAVPGYALYASPKRRCAVSPRHIATSWGRTSGSTWSTHRDTNRLLQRGGKRHAGSVAVTNCGNRRPSHHQRARNETDDIFPSKLFRMLNTLNRVMPFVHRGSQLGKTESCKHRKAGKRNRPTRSSRRLLRGEEPADEAYTRWKQEHTF